ncbi:SCO family protein [Hylemonella gracilis]|jgi:protein SCO1/2|uniref:SCO family protein n=1 Tax=Hylemonella gracilis TaxID=80880 RepID=A0A4P6UHH1_9BURK|nr:SCO family protein [Hylemonella gracilis]QBK03510.1 SCO family protein [Hylemonella gracilis]
MKKLLCALCAVLLLVACSESRQNAFNAIDVTGAEYAKDFSLTDHDGHQRSLADFKGKVVAMFFGYTQCPDVCPTTMSEMVAVKQALNADGRGDGNKLQVLFVTVDPERDTPAIMKNYMAAFDPGFLALYASNPEQLTALTKDYKVYYKKVEGKTPGSYTMDHSAGLYLYDPQGRLRLYARYGSGVESLTADIRQLLQ